MFKLITKRSELTKWISNTDTSKLGLVPTMGNLHEGHISLVQESLKDNQSTVVTIFVNPKQFGKNEDFDTYPRTIDQDELKLQEAHKEYPTRTLIIFAPDSNEEIYPHGFSTTISITGLTQMLCGSKRPGHFDGVTTVVYQLFTLTKATRAYFGQKDYQQVCVIKKMVKDLNLDTQVVMMPISRDDDGLARSSRNQYLTPQQRTLGLELPQTLQKLSHVLKQNTWINSGAEINYILEQTLKNERWDYLEILDAINLQEVGPNTTTVVLVGAFKIEKTRLIDNQLVDITYA